jgi:hypothetical protein
MKSWDDLKPDFDRIVLRRGAAQVAGEIPADRVTVYRLLKGETTRPSNAIRAGVERIVNKDQRTPE